MIKLGLQDIFNLIVLLDIFGIFIKNIFGKLIKNFIWKEFVFILFLKI